MDITQILVDAEEGDETARARLIEACYNELRKLAAGKMIDERQDHTLTSTALVHEVFLNLLADS